MMPLSLHEKAAAVLDDGGAGGWSIGGVVYVRRCRGDLWARLCAVVAGDCGRITLQW